MERMPRAVKDLATEWNLPRLSSQKDPSFLCPKRRLGLDDNRSWVVLTEANRFCWPGPDLSMAKPGDPASILYGELSGKLLMQIIDKFVEAIEAGYSVLVPRTQ